MTQSRNSRATVYDTESFVSSLVSAVFFGTVWYFAAAPFLNGIEVLKSFPTLLKVAPYVGPLFMVFRIGRFTKEFLDTVAAKRASQSINAAVDRIKEQSPGKNVAEISVEEVAASVKGTKVSQDALKRLVEQRKQHHLIDHHYFKEEVGQMIADYLQPLPRDAKRVLNRFRVNLLIAHSRQLLTTAPKVNTQQIGKWLVLDERWPQLSRSLCLHPEEMARLEEQSAPPARSARKPVNPDAFKELVKTLAPAYVDDDVLRTFVHSEPALAAILPRLVHYGVESQIKS